MVKDLVAFYGGGLEIEHRFRISRFEYQKIANGYHVLDQEQKFDPIEQQLFIQSHT
jgi:hypothetical protein